MAHALCAGYANGAHEGKTFSDELRTKNRFFWIAHTIVVHELFSFPLLEHWKEYPCTHLIKKHNITYYKSVWDQVMCECSGNFQRIHASFNYLAFKINLHARLPQLKSRICKTILLIHINNKNSHLISSGIRCKLRHLHTPTQGNGKKSNFFFFFFFAFKY